MAELKLKGKRALITGGSRGMGRAAAKYLAAEGVNVAINYVSNADAANATVDACKAHGVDAIAVKADVGDDDQVKAIVDEVKEAFGGIDILVHSAGIASEGPEPEKWLKVVNNHLNATHWVCRHTVPVMQETADEGSIVVISSIAAHTCAADSYCASMAAKLNYAKGLAKRVAKDNIRVNTISPGQIFTEMLDPFFPKPQRKEWTDKNIPLWKSREGIPEEDEVGKVVLFLCSDLASNVTGQYIPVNGGQDIHLL